MLEIEKKIHYCWFGGTPLPEIAIKCIESWKKYCPSCDIIEWNEENFNLDCCQYVKEAAEAKKWAFVSDYARFWIIYNCGGLYFDTDVELINPIDDILKKGAFMGMESWGVIAPGLGIAAAKYNALYKEILEYYQNICYFKYPGVPNEGNVVSITTKILKQHGFDVDYKDAQNIDNIWIYPPDYFCPMDYISGKVTISSNTRSIHHYAATWINPLEKKITAIERKYDIKGSFYHKIGRCITLPMRIYNKIDNLGIKGTLDFITWKIRK